MATSRRGPANTAVYWMPSEFGAVVRAANSLPPRPRSAASGRQREGGRSGLVPIQLDVARIMGAPAYAVPKGGQRGQLRAAADADARGAASAAGEGQGSATGGPAPLPVSGDRRGRPRLLGRRGGRSRRLQRAAMVAETLRPCGETRCCRSRSFHRPVSRTRCKCSRTCSRPAGPRGGSSAPGLLACSEDRRDWTPQTRGSCLPCGHSRPQ